MALLRRAQHLFARNGTFIALAALIIVFASLNDRFFTSANAEVIGSGVSEMGIVAVPLALLVISGSVDLSVGSIASMSGIICASVMTHSHSPILGVAAALGFGLGAGMINGFLVSVLRLNGIVVTLGFLAVWGGLALYSTNGDTLAGLPDSFTRFGTAHILGVPLQIYVLAVGAAIGWFLLNRRPFGRHIYAVGGNERAAFLMGVRVTRVRLLMFVYVGVAAAFAGVMLVAKLQAAPPTVGQGMELSVLTMVLLGGVGFAGGTGRVSGVMAGLFFVGVLQNGLVVTGASQFLQQVFVGATLVVAVALDATIKKVVHRSWQSPDGGLSSRPAAGSGAERPPSAEGAEVALTTSASAQR